MLKHWILAIRPLTLPAGLAPVLIGCFFTIKQGVFDGFYAAITVIAALCIQIGTNFVNDYADFEKGADTEERKGPLRMVQAGLISVPQMKRAAFIVFTLAFILGLLLVAHAGLPILIIGLASLLLGYMYTGGPYPLAYLGLADLVVLLFFGPVATAGTVFVQTGAWEADMLIMGLGVGAISMALLAINNLRDEKEDIKANKRTLVVRFGHHFGKFEYIFCLTTSFVALMLMTPNSLLDYMAITLYLLLITKLELTLYRGSPAPYIKILKGTGGLLLIYPFIYAVVLLV